MTFASIFSGLKSWFSTSSSIIGTSGIGGTLTALATHHVTLTEALPGLVFSLTAILMPQKPSAAANAKLVTADVLQVLSDIQKMPVSTRAAVNDVR